MRELGRTSPPVIAYILGQKGIAKHPLIYLPFFFAFFKLSFGFQVTT
jgi:hypothetical protein